jgi:hypothetical protein
MRLPTFIVIGAYKSGTTSLYRYLKQHPEVFMPAVKEPNFFAHERKKELLAGEGRAERVIDTMAAYQQLFVGSEGARAIGEASPLYLGSALAADRIQAALPDVRLIAILRQPIDAFLSDHNMRIRDRRQLEADFRARVEAVGRKIAAGEAAGPLYGAQLATWYERFDPARIRVYLFEDLIADGPALLADLFRFIGVDATFAPDLSEEANSGGMPRSAALANMLAGLRKRRPVRALPGALGAIGAVERLNLHKFPPVPRALRRELTAIFRADIEQLARLIGRDLSGWLA